MSVEKIIDKALAGHRLSAEDGIQLLESTDLILLGKAAHTIKERKHPDKVITFVIDRNINYTNVCKVKCRFCAFYRQQDAPDAYVLSKEEIFNKIQETVDLGGTQILMQGGLHPDLDFDYYLTLISDIKSHFKVHIHSFSPPEISHMASITGKTLPYVISALKEAGLDSIPGGGAEILDNRVRHYISPRKISWEQWLQVMEEAHYLNLKTTATMMFGSVETLSERIMHLIRIREL
ncbi:MAG: radical SAM protein, partial [Bacillota bacterium]|nr:radical SAM protein [Bacillota bacterium]